MQKVSGITTFIVGGLLVLGACGSPAVKATAIPSPAATTPTAPVPVATTPAAPAPVAATPVAPAPVAATPVAPAPTPVPGVQTAVAGAAFTTSNLKITPSKAGPGDEVEITVTVKNTGGQEGTYSVLLQFKGDDEACPMIPDEAKKVTVAAGAAQDVIFKNTMGKGLGGGYTVMIDQLKGRLVVD